MPIPGSADNELTKPQRIFIPCVADPSGILSILSALLYAVINEVTAIAPDTTRVPIPIDTEPAVKPAVCLEIIVIAFFITCGEASFSSNLLPNPLRASTAPLDGQYLEAAFMALFTDSLALAIID